MKTCEEIQKEVLRRRDSYIIEKAIKRKLFLKRASVVSCICFAAVILIFADRTGLFNGNTENFTNTSLPENSEVQSENEYISNSGVGHVTVTEERQNNNADKDKEGSEDVETGYDPSKEDNDITQSITPSAVRKTVKANLDEARRLSGEALKKCDQPDFIGFTLGMVTLNGSEANGEKVCSDITYEFKKGFIFIHNGKVYDLPSEPIHVKDINGDPFYKNMVSVSYKDRIFYTEHTEDGNIMIMYFPNNKQFAYQAEFKLSENTLNSDIKFKAETESIYELIISIEI